MKKTACYDVHLDLGAKMVDFAGWSMPVQYGSMIKEHESVREACGLFDCSHMGQVFVEGSDAEAFIQKLISNNLQRIRHGKAIYSGMLTEAGTFVDDLIVYWRGENRFMIIVNASNIEKDVAWMKQVAETEGQNVEVDDRSEGHGLLAIQGPQAPQVVEKLFPGVYGELESFSFVETQHAGAPGFICRTGYTGEAGVEVIFPNEVMPQLMRAFIEAGALPCGLGARDSLRLEKGYSLYGHEITDETHALEAGLAWTVDLAKTDFIGKAALEKVKAEGQAHRLIGFVMEERAIARHGDDVCDAQGQAIGKVTSGVFSPALKKGIGLAYVPSDLEGDEVFMKVRKKVMKAKRHKRAFV